MTYHWTYPAPEFDSGVEKDLNNIFVARASLPEQLSVHTAPNGALYLFTLYFTNISLLTELFIKTIYIIASTIRVEAILYK